MNYMIYISLKNLNIIFIYYYFYDILIQIKEKKIGMNNHYLMTTKTKFYDQQILKDNLF